MTLEVADVYDRGKHLRQENKQKRDTAVTIKLLGIVKRKSG